MANSKEKYIEAVVAAIRRQEGSLKVKVLAENTFRDKIANEKYQGHYAERIAQVDKATTWQELTGKIFGRSGKTQTNARLKAYNKISGVSNPSQKRTGEDIFISGYADNYYDNRDLIIRYNELNALGGARTDAENDEFNAVAAEMEEQWASHRWK